MSAAVVSGAAAVMVQAHPEWTNDQVKWALMGSAQQLGTSDPTTGAFTPYPGQGAGEIDVHAALTRSGSTGFANQGLTISPLLAGPNGATTYTTSSTTSSWKTSSWKTSLWKTSSWK